MDKQNAEKLVSEAFNLPFNEEKYSELVSNIFKTTLNKSEERTDILEKLSELVNSLKILSNIKDQNGKLIDVIEVELKDEISIDKSRYIQRNIAKFYLKKENCDAVLISFHNRNSEDWRLSLVTREVEAKINKSGSIKINIKTSPVKKLSYLVGKNEPNFTAKNQIINLLIQNNNNLEDIKNAFNIEKVTDDFFNDYKNLYLILKNEIDYLRQKNKKLNLDFEKNKIQSENFSKKTLGQIVFLFFLQKKGWLGIERNENNNFKKWGSGSKNFISELFSKYETKKIAGKNFFNDILEPIFYDALNNPEDFYEKLDCKIPFLNGGLFEPINGYNWYETDILIDDQIIKNILSIFNQYNFTVIEDQPLDREVAVDPEMLGKVFEKLLSEKERKKEGAHYTPREVVQYMCRKSIFYYLNKNIDEGIIEEEFDFFLYIIDNFEYDLLEDLKKTKIINHLKKIDHLLENIKICDPAIGSGAFPVSMMIEIVNIRNLIGNLFNKKNNIYELKRNFIENNLYGVDKDIGAVDIAKLRLWLSLIVDEKSFEKINPLPNLDYKIIQGNSLVESIYGIDFTFQKQSNLLEFSDNNLSSDLSILLDKYYNTSIRKNKDKFKKEIKESFSKLVLYLINSSGKKISRENLELINKNTYEIFDEKKEKNYFLWNIFFNQIFEKNGGFDLIISNPPYIKEYTDKEAFSQINKHQYYQGKMDIWYFMTCKSLDHLNKNGVLCFIAQNNWFTNAGAKKLRDKITQDAQILEINDFSNFMIFDSANQQTMIMILDKSSSKKLYSFQFKKVVSDKFSKRDLKNFFELKKNDKIETNKIYFDRNKMLDQNFNFNSEKIDRFLDKIYSLKNFYLKDSDISNGIHPHHAKISKKHTEETKGKFKKDDGVFVLNEVEINNLNLSIAEKKLLKPVYYPKNLKKFYSKEKTNEYILYLSNDFNNNNIINQLPKIKSHLDKFQSIITSDFKPYGLHRKRNENFFQGEKIASLRKCSEPKFTYTDYDCYLLADHYVIKTDRINLKYLTLYLNSKIIKFWLKYKGKMQGNNYQVDAEPILNIPIFCPKNLNHYLKLFSDIQKFNLQNDKIFDLEINLNKSFYKEFNLNQEEIDYIEENI